MPMATAEINLSQNPVTHCIVSDWSDKALLVLLSNDNVLSQSMQTRLPTSIPSRWDWIDTTVLNAVLVKGMGIPEYFHHGVVCKRRNTSNFVLGVFDLQVCSQSVWNPAIPTCALCISGTIPQNCTIIQVGHFLVWLFATKKIFTTKLQLLKAMRSDKESLLRHTERRM